jgi:hypothetical protein
MHPSWGLTLEQTIGLLKWRCKAIGYEEDIDESGIRSGAPSACLRILRFVFCNFSEALAEHLEANNLDFDEDMGDEAFVDHILRAWSLVSPQALLGSISAEKMLASCTWANDRLLFTLQCIFVCAEKHGELVRNNLEVIHDDTWWKDVDSAGGSMARHSVNGGEHADVFAWMKEVYREQLDAVNHPEEADAGAAQQAAWVAAIRGGEVGHTKDVNGGENGATTSDILQHGAFTDTTGSMLDETASTHLCAKLDG